LGVYALLTMPSWARLRPKLYGFLGGVGSGVGSGLLWHFATIDPPSIVVIEAILAVSLILLLAIPHSPQTPNLNLIPIIH